MNAGYHHIVLFKSIVKKAILLICITLESVPGINQCSALNSEGKTFLLKESMGAFDGVSNSRLTSIH